ncbi:MAG: response regulator [Planctomycetota bacterium]|nr:response regulator [Planctomycetota bacterium]
MAEPGGLAPLLRGAVPGPCTPSSFDRFEDALRAAQTGAYELAVLDLTPRSDPREVLAEIKAFRKAAADVQVIATHRNPLGSLEKDLRILGVADVVSGDEVTPGVLRRSVRLAMERKRITRELQQVSRMRKSQQLGASVLEEVRHAVLGVDVDGQIVYANAAAGRLLSKLPDQLLGGPFLGLVEVDHRSRVTRVLERSCHGYGTTALECKLRRGQVGGSWVSMDVTPWRRGAPDATGSLIVAHDISDRQTLRPSDCAVDEELQAALAAVLDSLPVGILIADAGGRPKVVNRIARDLLGMNALLPVDRWPATEIFYTADGAPAREQDLPVFHTLRDGLPRREVELQVGRPGTRPVPVLVNTSAARDEHGCVVEVCCIFTNISERKRIEEQLHQAQKVSEISGLVGGVAHDFNNMLCAIMGYADLLESLGLDNDNATRLASEIRKAGDRAAMLTRQLLTFSRREERRPRVFPLNDSVGDMENLLRRLINEDIRLLTELNDSSGNVRADPGRVGQVLLNLVVNARDAMPAGGDLHVSTRAVRIKQRELDGDPSVEPGEYVLLTVRDTGIGMDEETLQRIFEPYFTTKSRAHGTGLGLSTVYDIVKQCGGHIRVESQMGIGTEFFVYLPRVTEKATVDNPCAERTPAVSGDREIVLLVEDEPMVRALIREILELKDYVVIEAADGRQALDLCGRHGKDIRAMVTDVVMPEMSGRELAERVRASHPDIRVLFVSGYTADALLRYGVSQQEVDFLQKPFAPGELTHRLGTLMDASAPTRNGQNGTDEGTRRSA